jgi:low affinity Fe/Cu permease
MALYRHVQGHRICEPAEQAHLHSLHAKQTGSQVIGSRNLITFLMVFLIQNTQNRDSTAIQLKLDEIIRGVKGARTGFVNPEDLSDDERISDPQAVAQELRQEREQDAEGS